MISIHHHLHRYTIPVALFLMIVSACQIPKEFAGSAQGRHLYRFIDTNPVFSRHHTGFALYDPVRDTWMCRYQADKYFTPASNTKLLTLLTCLHVLEDSIETMRYVIRGDTMFFWGMGDPAFLYSGVPSSRRAFDILKDHPGELVYMAGETPGIYGPGWAWDDYAQPYQVERSIMPVYGNRVTVRVNAEGEIITTPRYFQDYFLEDPTQQDAVKRDLFTNTFTVNPSRIPADDSVNVPFTVSDYEITRILADTLHRSVGLMYGNLPGLLALSVYGAARDTLLKQMIRKSDNFIAEQLLMQCAYFMRGTFESDSAIAVAKRMIFNTATGKLYWVDGSGLSRYNLLTPEAIVWTLDALRKMTSWADLTDIFPAGGQSGTIANHYGGEAPYVYAKTGTLRNQHCLSGYIRTARGRWLIFSFMHNHFTGSSAEVKKEMEKVLREIQSQF